MCYDSIIINYIIMTVHCFEFFMKYVVVRTIFCKKINRQSDGNRDCKMLNYNSQCVPRLSPPPGVVVL